MKAHWINKGYVWYVYVYDRSFNFDQQGDLNHLHQTLATHWAQRSLQPDLDHQPWFWQRESQWQASHSCHSWPAWCTWLPCWAVSSSTLWTTPAGPCWQTHALRPATDAFSVPETSSNSCSPSRSCPRWPALQCWLRLISLRFGQACWAAFVASRSKCLQPRCWLICLIFSSGCFCVRSLLHDFQRHASHDSL